RVRSTANADGVQSRPSGGDDVVVHAVADIEDLVGRGSRGRDDVSEEAGVRLLYPPALRRADEVDMRTEELLVTGVHVPRGADSQAASSQCGKARKCVRVEVSVREYERGRAVRLPALVRSCLVHEGLAHVEDDDAQRHPATVSRSASDVTLSRRG